MPSSSNLAPCFFENLPAEMHEEISKYLDHGALLALSYTSKVCSTFTKPFLYRHVAICHSNVGLLLRTLVEKEEYRKMVFYLQSVLGIRGFHCDVEYYEDGSLGLSPYRHDYRKYLSNDDVVHIRSTLQSEWAQDGLQSPGYRRTFETMEQRGDTLACASMVLRLLPNLKRAHLGDRTSSDLHQFQPYRKPKNGPYWQMPFQFGTFNQLSEVVLDCDHWRHQWLEGVLPLLKHGNLKTLRINDIRDSDVDDHEEMALIGLPEHEETKRKNIEALERIMSDTELWGKLQVLELRPGPICWDEMVLPIMHACRGLRKLSFGVEDRHTDRYASTHILASKMWPVMIQLQGYVEELAIWAELWRHKKSHFDDGFVSFSKLRHLAIDDCALRGDWHEYGLQDLFPSSLETLRLHGLSEYRMKHVWAADGLLQRLSNAKKSDSQMFPRLWYLELSCGDIEEIDLYSDENTPERLDALIGDLRDAGIWARPMLDKYPHCTDFSYPKDSRWYRDISTKELEDYKQAKDDAYFERWGPWYTTGFINEDEVHEDMYWHFNR